jgi:hypothetical protein
MEWWINTHDTVEFTAKQQDKTGTEHVHTLRLCYIEWRTKMHDMVESAAEQHNKRNYDYMISAGGTL